MIDMLGEPNECVGAKATLKRYENDQPMMLDGENLGVMGHKNKTQTPTQTNMIGGEEMNRGGSA